MWSLELVVVYICIFAAIFENSKIQAKTYYFNINKTTNEYEISNRRVIEAPVYSKYPSNLFMGELRNNVSRKQDLQTSTPQVYPLLDHEWDYNWQNITRDKLPSYIHKLYYNLAEKETINGQVRILFNDMPLNSSLLQFNLTSISLSHNVSDVELHFYLNIERNLFQKSLILRLYQIDKDYYNETSLINPDSHKLLNVIYVLQADSGWQVFKLTNSIQNALKEQTDLVLLVTISKPNEEAFTLFEDTNNNTMRTFLLWKTISSEKDSTSSDKLSYENTSCSKHDLYIDFEKFNWMKFIIAPQGYNASNCYGKCYNSDKLPNHIKLANSNNEFKRKPLCCGATNYASLPIMFYDSNGNVVIKSYDEMVVAKCGCR